MVTREDLEKYIRHNQITPPKVLRKHFMETDPHCHWCGIEVREYNFGNLKKGQYAPLDMATIDHLYDRFEPEKRYQVYPNHEDKVLSCFGCNQARHDKRTESLTLEQKIKRNEVAIQRKAEAKDVPRVIYFMEKGV